MCAGNSYYSQNYIQNVAKSLYLTKLPSQRKTKKIMLGECTISDGFRNRSNNYALSARHISKINKQIYMKSLKKAEPVEGRGCNEPEQDVRFKKLSTNLNRHQTKHNTFLLQASSRPTPAPAVTGLLTWGLVHFQIKYQLRGVGHHHVPPVSFLAGFFRRPNCVIHRSRVV